MSLHTMPASTHAIMPDLGLNSPGFPDLADASTRKKLSPAALAAFFKIVEKWKVKDKDAMTLLGGISNGTFYQYKRGGKGVLSQDQLTRVSLMIGIFKALNILFSRKLADAWVLLPNSNPMFNNAPPLGLLVRGGLPAMISVRQLLDARRGGR